MLGRHQQLSTMESPKSDSLCDRFVTGNLDIDNWILIIEYFAKFKTELWMLHDVFEMAPELPDYLGEHTNEMVAFRCLASLFDSDVVSDDNSKVEFDSSETCEYVLQCILDEIPLSELKPGAPGLSKWNLLPFIKSKLLCLPKCALELMIEPSSHEKDTQVLSPCDDEETLRSGGIETERLTPSPSMAEPDLMGRTEGGQSFCRDLGDGTEEISRSYEKDTQMSPCDDEETVRSDGIETERLTPPMAEPDLMERTEGAESFCRNLGDGTEEISRSHELLERQNEELQNASPPEKVYRCIHCKVSGKLLFCSGDGCEVMVHQKCLDSPPAYDDDGNFYCSPCSLTCTSAEYLQSQEEVAKAKIKLASFLRLMSEVNKKKSTERT